MKAVLLAAGLGKRMRPLTDHCPKPLLHAGDKRLIEFHLEALSAIGITEIVVNTYWHSDQVIDFLGDGKRWGMKVTISHETELLETAGGIKKAINLLNLNHDEAFLVVNGDVYTEIDWKTWLSNSSEEIRSYQAHLVLVTNPKHNPDGDFTFDVLNNKLSLRNTNVDQDTFTYSGIGLFTPRFFENVPEGKQALAPFLFEGIEKGTVTGSVNKAYWSDIGTPERLEQLAARLGTKLPT